MIPRVRIIRVKRFKGESKGYSYWLVKDVDTTQNLHIEPSMTEAIKQVEDNGYILQPETYTAYV